MEKKIWKTCGLEDIPNNEFAYKLKNMHVVVTYKYYIQE